MQSFLRNTVVRTASFVIVVLFAIVIVTLRLDNNEKQERIAELNAQITEVNDYINELTADLQKPFDDAYIEEVATEKLGMRYPQEVIFYSGNSN
ncbi:MAG: septum formation initiator family protein [Clostridia bacterium]|nr:septum formation initiator family protein [Clostridia bacterium]